MAEVESKYCALIGGSGLYKLEGFESIGLIHTPYGDVSGVSEGVFEGERVYFLSRHGGQQQIPPHKINYRANIWALHSLGVSFVFAINAVGGIRGSMGPGQIVIPNQVIDYSYGREHTYSDGTDLNSDVVYVDFSEPFSARLRDVLVSQCQKSLSSQDYSEEGVYACTQGPRLETVAEIARLKRDGADVVGMTLMPEAVLAKELGIEYASACVVANWAAGVGKQNLVLEVVWTTLLGALATVKPILIDAIVAINTQKH